MIIKTGKNTKSKQWVNPTLMYVEDWVSCWRIYIRIKDNTYKINNRKSYWEYFTNNMIILQNDNYVITYFDTIVDGEYVIKLYSNLTKIDRNIIQQAIDTIIIKGIK